MRLAQWLASHQRDRGTDDRLYWPPSEDASSGAGPLPQVLSSRMTSTDSKRAISRLRYQAAFRRSSRPPLSACRQMYFMAFPKQKFIHSVTAMHSTPEGCPV